MPYRKNPVGGYDDIEIRRSMKELNKKIKEIEEVYTEAEGTEITVETVEGYARDIEILGNTIQDANNLEIIKSVGDKVKGQNVYKIDILVTNGLKKTDANYQEEVITILSPVQLEKVGDVADRIICKDGVWGVEKLYQHNWDNISFTAPIGQFDTDDITEKYNVFRLMKMGYNLIEKGIYPFFRLNGSFDDFRFYDGECVWGSSAYLYFKILKGKTTLDEFKVGKSFDFIVLSDNPTFIPLPYDQQVKLRTFANKTNISFLTEIEGTIKVNVANTMVSNVGFQVKQIDDLNNELNRIKRLEDNTIFNIEMEENFVTINGSSSGYLKNIKIEGKTVRLDINGEVTEDVSKGKSLKSVGDGVDEVSVVSVNENLFNGVVKNQTVNTEGLIAPNEKARTTDFIEVPSDCSITINIKMLNQDRYGIVEYDTNKRFVKFHNAASLSSMNVYTFEPDKNTKYIMYYYNSSAQIADEDIPNHIMVSIGTEPKPYVPHQSDKKSLLYYNPTSQQWEKPILRQWDSIEKHSNGKYYYHKRSEEVVLNGSESWIDVTSTDELSGTDLYFTFKNTKLNSVNGIFDKFLFVNSNDGFKSYVGECCFINNYGTTFKILKSKLSTQDTAGFRQWLQANPTTVVYLLEQEEVYECTNIDLITYANETNLIINCGVVTPKITLESQNNITDVVTIMQEKTSFLRNRLTEMSKDFLSGDYYSLAYSLYPEDFLADDEDNENIEE